MSYELTPNGVRFIWKTEDRENFIPYEAFLNSSFVDVVKNDDGNVDLVFGADSMGELSFPTPLTQQQADELIRELFPGSNPTA